MRSTLSLFCLLGLIVAYVLAAPTPAPIKKRSFKVERVANPNFQGHDGPAQLIKSLRKYKMSLPASLQDRVNEAALAAKAARKKTHKNAGSTNTAATADANGTATSNVGLVSNTPTSSDTEFLSPITIGGQTLMMDFDTGSSDLWVFNTQLSARQTGGQTLYDPTKSSTFQMLKGQTFAISYGDGSQVAGNVGTDTVTIGGATVTKQAIELATAVSSSFISDAASDGLVGLAYSVLNTVSPTQQNTFFANVLNDLAEPILAANLRHNATGSYEFGAIDPTQFTGTLANIPINTTQGFWQFASTSFAVDGGAAQTSSATGQAIADTGTTLLLANDAIVNGYFANVAGAENNEQLGGITIPCDADLPDLQLDVGGTMATVKGTDIMFTQVAANTCFSGLQATTSDLMIFGDVFFKSNYVVFNGGNNTLSFATHA